MTKVLVTGGAGFLTGASPAFTAPADVSSIRFELVTTDASGLAESTLTLTSTGTVAVRIVAAFKNSLSGEADPAWLSRFPQELTAPTERSRSLPVIECHSAGILSGIRLSASNVFLNRNQP